MQALRRWWPWLLVLALALWLFGAAAVSTVRDYVTRGARLTTSTITDGVVDQSIAQLVQDASSTVGRAIPVDTYSVARMLRSEYGSGPVAAKIAMAWVARNDAAELGRSVTATINAGTRAGVAYGAQAGGGRYSTAHDPYENDLAIAEAVMTGDEADPTGGAVKFVHKSGFATSSGYDDTVTKWAAEGLSPVEKDGWGQLVVFVRDGAREVNS
jgi:hypothetical protein